MSTSTSYSVIQLLAIGLLLAVLKVVYMFFDPFNIADFIVFLAAGYLLGGKLPANRKWLGLLMCIPTLIICFLAVRKNGFTGFMNGIGTTYAIAFIVIPAATLLGIYFQTKRSQRKSITKQ
ncbi:hypothetical protein [Lacibacter sp.]|uniref:hypothetical protein n=1 Tax=Lacibacter sp. TaxID=1915409 RepID=UPI002B4B291E|nr:hypothetical protein [Lacibacter sp.]HLP39364.1 hypothetical protein [Lacibacter sp.]